MYMYFIKLTSYEKKQVAEGETLRIVMCIYSEELIIK